MATETRQAAAEIYDRVRAEIVHGLLRPNQRLVEADLAERLGVSRTPVRETLQRLALDGLVGRDRSGWVVHEHSAQEIREIYEVRAALDGYAAWLAAGRATVDQLRALDGLYPPGDDVLELPPDEQVERNERFHDGIIAAAGNMRLARLCASGRQYYFNHRIARRYAPEETRQSIEGHRRILAALMQGDGPAAEAHAREHVEYALEIVLAKVT